MKKHISIFGLAAILFACGQDKDRVIELEGQVLAIHDEVMPRMDDIMTLKSQLSKKILKMDSLQNEGISGNNIAEERMKAADLNQKLNESDKLMMEWMHTYRGDSAKKLQPEQAVLYFEAEKKKIEEVKQVTIKSIKDTQDFLAN
jgi:hypothetical protein